MQNFDRISNHHTTYPTRLKHVKQIKTKGKRRRGEQQQKAHTECLNVMLNTHEIHFIKFINKHVICYNFQAMNTNCDRDLEIRF